MVLYKYIKSRKARKAKMEYQEFKENADVTLHLTVYVNGDCIWESEHPDTDYLQENLRAVENEINKTLELTYQDLPERTI